MLRLLSRRAAPALLAAGLLAPLSTAALAEGSFDFTPAITYHFGAEFDLYDYEFDRVTFDIEGQEDGTVRLTVTHDQLQPGSGMAEGISKGLPLVLSSMKSFLETGTGMDL